MTLDDILVERARAKGKTITLTEEEREMINFTINHIKEMIAENERMIELGDDVEGRTRLISALEDKIQEEENKLL